MLGVVARTAPVCLLWVLAFGPSACRCSDRAGPGGPALVCEQKGTVYLVDSALSGSSTISVRAVHGGCVPCPNRMSKGAAAGDQCSLHRVCAEQCCACPGRQRFFTATACNDRACATPELTCQTALSRFGADLCGE